MIGLLFRGLLVAAGINAGLVALALVGAAITPGYAHLMYEGWMEDNAEIFLFDVQRNILRNLTNHPAQDVHPIWSPDGRTIAFESTREGARWIYLMDADGRHVRRLTTQTEIGEADPAWSADGNHVLFRGLRRRGTPIFSVNIHTGVMERVNLTGVPRPVDSERIVFMSYREGKWGIYVTDPARTDTYLLTQNNVGFSETPHWSPDNRQVAFLSQNGATSQVFALNADGSNFRQVTFDRTLKIGLSWRP